MKISPSLRTATEIVLKGHGAADVVAMLGKVICETPDSVPVRTWLSQVDRIVTTPMEQNNYVDFCKSIDFDPALIATKDSARQLYGDLMNYVQRYGVNEPMLDYSERCLPWVCMTLITKYWDILGALQKQSLVRLALAFNRASCNVAYSDRLIVDAQETYSAYSNTATRLPGEILRVLNSGSIDDFYDLIDTFLDDLDVEGARRDPQSWFVTVTVAYITRKEITP